MHTICFCAPESYIILTNQFCMFARECRLFIFMIIRLLQLCNMLEHDMFSASAEDYKIIRWAVPLQYWKDYLEMELKFRGNFCQLRTGVLTQPSATNHFAQVNSVSTGTADVLGCHLSRLITVFIYIIKAVNVCMYVCMCACPSSIS